LLPIDPANYSADEFRSMTEMKRCLGATGKGVDLQWVQFPPGTGSLQLVAIGTSVKVTISAREAAAAEGNQNATEDETRKNAFSTDDPGPIYAEAI
jgi:hypothetical protein